jgi:hypothetical protein
VLLNSGRHLVQGGVVVGGVGDPGFLSMRPHSSDATFQLETASTSASARENASENHQHHYHPSPVLMAAWSVLSPRPVDGAVRTISESRAYLSAQQARTK